MTHAPHQTIRLCLLLAILCTAWCKTTYNVTPPDAWTAYHAAPEMYTSMHDECTGTCPGGLKCVQYWESKSVCDCDAPTSTTDCSCVADGNTYRRWVKSGSDCLLAGGEMCKLAPTAGAKPEQCVETHKCITFPGAHAAYGFCRRSSAPALSSGFSLILLLVLPIFLGADHSFKIFNSAKELKL